MNGITIIETDAIEALIRKIDDLSAQVKIIEQERAKAASPLMTVVEVRRFLQKGTTWLDANKAIIGYSKVGGELRFRRSDVDAFLESNYFRTSTRINRK